MGTLFSNGSSERESLRDAILRLITRLSDGSRDDEARDALLMRLLAYQRRAVDPYRRLCDARLAETPRAPGDYPALPTDVFRHARVAAHEPQRDVRVFRTSGTSEQQRGVHALCELTLYDEAARAAAKHGLFPERERIDLVVLAPDPSEALDSSLSYMLSRFLDWFGSSQSAVCWRNGQLDLETLHRCLDRAVQRARPLALAGTSFAFVHAHDKLGSRRWRLPHHSRIMQTGGFKGRSREIDPTQMLGLLSQRYGISPAWIIQEYGMTELSSQMYESSLRSAALAGDVETPATEAHARTLWVPGWMRAQPVDPETLRPVPAGKVGLLRMDDLANLDTAAALQTSDLARHNGHGIVLLGRAPGAVPRGCSLAADAALAVQ